MTMDANLKIARRKKGLTQVQLSQKMQELGRKVSAQQISSWERGDYFPSHRNLSAISEILGVAPVTHSIVQSLSSVGIGGDTTGNLANEFSMVVKKKGAISAGPGLTPTDQVDFQLAFRNDWLEKYGGVNQLVALQVEGDSMMKEIRGKYDADKDGKLSAEERAKISKDDKKRIKDAGIGPRKRPVVSKELRALHKEITEKYDENKDRKGPVPIAVVATRELPSEQPESPGESPDGQEDGKQKIRKARLVAIGDADIANNAYINISENGDFFLNTASWLVEEENLISIRPKKRKNNPLQLTQVDGSIIFILGTIVFTSIVAATGIRKWWKRRRL